MKGNNINLFLKYFDRFSSKVMACPIKTAVCMDITNAVFLYDIYIFFSALEIRLRKKHDGIK